MGLRLGLLSTARINRSIVAGARRTGAVDIVAVASRDRARAEEHAREHGIERALGSYEDLLADPDIDAIYVSLPNSMHVPWSVRALEAGKHVLCEKPMSRRPDEVERAFDAAEHAGLVLAEAFMWRHHPQAVRLVELLPRIGALRLVRAAFSFPLQRPADVRWEAALDGGALMDVGCYCVSAARLVAGEPVRVMGEQVLGGDGVDAAFTGALRFPHDVLGHFDCGFAMSPRGELEVVGEEGALFLADPWHGRTPAIEHRRAAGEVERVEIAAADPYTVQLEDFAAAVAGERPPRFGRADAVSQAGTLERLYEAAAA